MPPDKKDITWDPPDRSGIVWDEARPSPSAGGMALNSAMKGVAGVADMFGNAPVNAWNLAQGAYGYGMEAVGHPEAWLNVNVATQPNLARRGLESIGLIRPEYDPQTAGERIADTMIQGATGMAAGPGGLARNLATGTVGGLASQTTKELTGSDAAAIGVGLATPFALRGGSHPSANPVRDQTFREGQAAGYKVPPTAVEPSFLNERLESLAGKAAVKQDATARNQAVTDALIAQELGLPKGTPLTESTLKQVREEAAQPYKDIANLSPTAKDALEELKKARFESREQWNYYHKSGNPDAGTKARQADADVMLYDQVIAHEAQQAGRPELVKALADSRRTIAKTYEVERSLNVGDGSASAPIIGRSIDQSGVAGKSGNLAVIGKFQQAFPQFMGEGARTPAAGVSGTDAAMSAGLGLGGYGAAGPVGILAAGMPLVRGPARTLALSDWYQRRLLGGRPPEPMGDTVSRAALLSRAIAERNQH